LTPVAGRHEKQRHLCKEIGLFFRSYRAHLIHEWALSIQYRALLLQYRPLLGEYRASVIPRRVLLSHVVDRQEDSGAFVEIKGTFVETWVSFDTIYGSFTKIKGSFVTCRRSSRE